MQKIITVLSGGMDSSLTAYKMRESGYEIIPLHFSYGQRTANRELKAFNDIADSLKVKKRYHLQLPFFSQIGIGITSLIDNSLKLNENGVDHSKIPNSYVPFRNGIMLAIAGAVAEKESAIGIAIGVVEEDSSGYPDCREEFISTFEKSLYLGTKAGNIKIFRPLVNLQKSQIVSEAIKLKVPLYLTWSCYQQENKACGVCDSCRLRLNGFKIAGEKDPILYIN